MMYANDKKRSRKTFYSLLALLLALCVVKFSAQINIPQGILLAVAVLIAVFGDQDEIIAMCVCCIPLHTSFEYAHAVLCGIAIYAVKFGGKIRLNMTVVPIFIMILWELLHCLGESFGIVQFGGQCVPLLLIAMLMCSRETRFDYELIVRSFAISTAAMCCSLVGRLLYAGGFNIWIALSGLRRLGLDTAETTVGNRINSNTLGIICVLCLGALLQLRIVGRGKRQDVLLIVILLVFGIMTSSKTFLACLIFMGILIVFSLESSLIRRLRFLVSAAVIMALSLLLLWIFAPDLLEFYLGRFSETDFTTGRLGLMADYHEFMMSDLKVLLFGIGLHDFYTKVMDIYQVTTHVPHNGIQELIVVWGLPGLLLFAALWFSMIVSSRKVCRKQGLINYVPFLVLMLKIQAGQMLDSPYTMLAFSFAYLSMCEDMVLQYDGKDNEWIAENGLDFYQAFAVLKRGSAVILTVSVVCAMAAFGITREVVTPLYESTAQFYVNNNSISLRDIAVSISTDDVTSSRLLIGPYMVVLKTRDTLERVAERVGSDMDYQELKSMIAASPVNDTEIFKVVVSSKDPGEAERIARAIAEILPQRISETINHTSVRVVDYPVLAEKPSWPNAVEHAMISFIFGFVLSVLVILVKAMKNTTICAREDIIHLDEYPLLAEIPDLSKKQSSGQ